MIHKRPFVDVDPYEVVYKQPKQLEPIELAPAVPLRDARQKCTTADGEGEDTYCRCHDEGRSASDSVSEISIGANSEFETGSTVCFPHFVWINNGILEADNLSFFPEYFDHVNPARALLQPNEVISSIDYPFQKSVLIGPEHQAYVPEWNQCILSTFSNQPDKTDPNVAPAQSSCLGIIVDDYEKNLMGTCVIQMPELDASENYNCEVSNGDCRCLHKGSFNCVRQHIAEARQTLRENLGDTLFEDLGLGDVGEEVAKKWTEEEERTFHGVVLANPVSGGKNFWDHLSATFPSRTKKELVSYYFNVYVLRKRAGQNRSDPLNIDSDNDEWHLSEAGPLVEDEEANRPFGVCFQEGQW